MQTIREILLAAVKDLENIRTARLDAEILLCFILKKERSFLYSHPEFIPDFPSVNRFWELIKLRKQFMPIAYLTGIKEFYGLEFQVSPDVLIPRPETEIIIEESLKFLKGKAKPAILDLCTGSGCIAVTLAHELNKLNTSFEITASDISEKALMIAKSNAAKFNLNQKINFLQSDLFENVPQIKYDLIVSNPPYVNRELSNLSPDLKYEPDLALYADNLGLALIEKILMRVSGFLHENSMLIIEIGSEQGEQLAKMPYLKCMEQRIIKDLAGLDRFICYHRPN